MTYITMQAWLIGVLLNQSMQRGHPILSQNILCGAINSKIITTTSITTQPHYPARSLFKYDNSWQIYY